MRKLNIPQHAVKAVLNALVATIQNPDLKRRLMEAVTLIEAAESVYLSKAELFKLYEISAANKIGEVLSDEASNLYTSSFVRKSSPTRHIYNEILLSANGICPLCNHFPAKTLDHHLAKSIHPAFTVTPANLIPSCKSCNLDTGARKIVMSSDQTIHPYFDSVDDSVWLKAEVDQIGQRIKFFADPPATWEESKQMLVKRHFEVFQLNSIYTIQAGVELVPNFHELNRIRLRGGPIDLRKHLLEKAQDRRHVGLNNWQAAMFQGMADSEWYCDSGYATIIQ